METLALPGRKTDRFLRMGMSKTLDGFERDSRDMRIALLDNHGVIS